MKSAKAVCWLRFKARKAWAVFGVLMLGLCVALGDDGLTIELLVTMPVEIEGECFCCAFVNAINSTVAVRQSAEHFCRNYNDTARSICIPSVVVDRHTCADRVSAALLQRLRSMEEGMLLPVKVHSTELYFYVRLAFTLPCTARKTYGCLLNDGLDCGSAGRPRHWSRTCHRSAHTTALTTLDAEQLCMRGRRGCFRRAGSTGTNPGRLVEVIFLLS